MSKMNNRLIHLESIMSRHKERKRETARAKSAEKLQAEEALKTLMCSVQTWDRLGRGSEKLGPLEEHPQVYPSLLIREFRKSSRHGQRWFVGLMACLKDFTPMAEPLLNIALNPEIYTEVKQELSALLEERGHSLGQDTINAIDESRSLSAELISELQKEDNGEKIEEKLPRIFALPEALGKSLLREVLEEVEGRALPLARAILEKGENPLSLYLMELLASTSSHELQQILVDAAGDKSKKELHKAAKKALYRLRSAGVQLEETRSASESILRAPRYTFFGASASLIDAEGNRMLWLARTKALGGLHLVNCLINDEKGVLECYVYETNRKNYQEVMDQMMAIYTAVEIDPLYCVHLIEEAAKLNAGSDTALPQEYLEAQQIIGKAERAFDRPMIYDHFREEEIYPNPVLLESGGRLFELDEFKGWHIPSDEMEPYNFKLQEAQESRIILSEQSQTERIEDIIGTAADELFQEKLRMLYSRRLEENALVLYLLDRRDDAKLALVAAVALKDESLPPRRQPFCSSLIERSLTLAEEESKDRLITPP
jgi:hypothetical protein